MFAIVCFVPVYGLCYGFVLMVSLICLTGDPLDDLLGDLDDDEDDDLDEFTQAALDPETTLLTRLTSFQQLLAEDSTCQTLAENENVAFIHLLEALPYVADSRQADVRYETLIQKLVFHIRENITLVR